ncbi:MAG: hypothetical protein KC457_07120 [Myxococcales bacterium]|nr:hypothetical protein [Myxococcales bacterium]
MSRIGRAALSALTLALVTTTVAVVGCEEDDPDLEASCRDLPPGYACTWVGMRDGEGFNGDMHHRTETLLAQPQDLLFLPDGTAWFTDFNNFLIRRVHPDGAVESMVGPTDPIFPGDGPLTGSRRAGRRAATGSSTTPPTCCCSPTVRSWWWPGTTTSC